MVRSTRVKLRTATLCLPILVISVQQNAVVMTLPPFLDAQRYPVATIGTLLSLGPIFTLAARVPGGMLYRRGRTTARMAIALLVVAATSALYSLADSAALFIVVGALNGFAKCRFQILLGHFRSQIGFFFLSFDTTHQRG